MPFEKKKIDEEWKRQAEIEKQKIEESLSGAPSSGESNPSDEGRPEEDKAASQQFVAIINQIALQAMIGLGQVEDPRTGTRGYDIDMARAFIDQLGVLQAKTKGNLSTDESQLLTDIVKSLRLGYVEITRAMQEQQLRQAQPGPETPPQ